MRADLLVHQRLGERRLVAFVVAEAPVAEHVDDDRLLEFLPELGRDLGGVDHRFGIVAVHVEDRRLDHLGDVGRIRRRARVARIGGEADLVVDDEMHRAAGAVALQARTGRSIRPPRPGRRRPRRRGSAAASPWCGLRGVAPCWSCLARTLPSTTGLTISRCDGFGGQRQMHLVAVELAVRRGAEVILHVARAFDVVRASPSRP